MTPFARRDAEARRRLIVRCVWTGGRVALALGALAALGAVALAQCVTVEELEGEPFARLRVVNICGHSDGEVTVETSRGPVTLRHVEGNNGCYVAPDLTEVFDLPPGVAADPPFVEQIELKPGASAPAFIHLYTYRGL